jgi:hypothetical protein
MALVVVSEVLEAQATLLYFIFALAEFNAVSAVLVASVERVYL